LTGISALAQNAKNTRPVHVPQGEKRKVQGVVGVRNGDTFTVRDPGGNETTVLLTAGTDVTSHGFRKKDYPVTYIMRGLRLQAQGRGDSDGNLVADWVRFDEQDLRSAQSLEETDELAKENNARIAAAEEAAKKAEEQARIMQGQIAENTALANDARAKAEAAVKWTKYPPFGRRSQGGGQYRELWGNDYRQTANDNMMVVIMIETPEGVANAEKIAAVPGIDVIFAASTDLGNFSGHKQGEPAYEALVTRIKDFALVTSIGDGPDRATGEAIQKQITMAFAGLQNPTLPSATKLMETAIDHDFYVDPRVQHRIAQADSCWGN
jgi:hypothetical protein